MELIRQISGALLVLGLLAGTLLVLQRQGRASFHGFRPNRAAGPKRLEVIERVPLSAQHSLQLVRCDNRTLLLSLHPGGCNLLLTTDQKQTEEPSL